MRNVFLKLAASLLVFATAAGPAAADDRKNYPGLACLATGSEITRIERVYWNGRATNPNTTYLDVQCPAVKDYASIASATVYVLDQHPGDQVACALRSGRVGGTATWAATDSTTDAFYSSAPTPLTLSGSGSPVDPMGFYWLSCYLPGQSSSGFSSGIVMYQIVENE